MCGSLSTQAYPSVPKRLGGRTKRLDLRLTTYPSARAAVGHGSRYAFDPASHFPPGKTLGVRAMIKREKYCSARWDIQIRGFDGFDDLAQRSGL